MTCTWIALLRGINVGGHNVAMAELRSYFDELGLKNVRSYIQTGNVFFESRDSDRQLLTDQISAHLAAKLGYPVPLFLRTVEELSAVFEKAPFANYELTDNSRHMITFIDKALPDNLVFPVLSPKGDVEIVGATPTEAFVIVHLINGKFLSSNFLEKSYGVQTTARFYHTLAKILVASES